MPLIFITEHNHSQELEVFKHNPSKYLAITVSRKSELSKQMIFKVLIRPQTFLCQWLHCTVLRAIRPFWGIFKIHVIMTLRHNLAFHCCMNGTKPMLEDCSRLSNYQGSGTQRQESRSPILYPHELQERSQKSVLLKNVTEKAIKIINLLISQPISIHL